STEDLGTEQLVQKLESLGGNIIAHSSRESIMYQAAIFRHDLEKVVSIFSSIIQRPLFLPEELDETRQTTAYEIQELSTRPDMMLPEILHAIAFSNPDQTSFNTLGRPLLCPMDKLETMTPEVIREFRSTWYTPERIVIAGVGMDHEYLVNLVDKHFSGMPKATPEIIAKQKALTKPAEYTGGIQFIDAHEMPPSPNPDDRPLTHVHIAFEGLSMSDPDIYALATLTSLMGGGGAFSAGGPGKGMYTRLYTQVLNRYHWVESCNMLNYSYLDSGLFGISASVPPSPDSHRSILPILCDQLLTMTAHITEEELSRAKNQLKSNLLMSLESRIVELEDVGRQIMVHGKRLGIQEMCKRIETLTPDDLKRVARRMVFGADIPSPFQYEGCTPWVRTGNGEPTVIIQGPLKYNDPLMSAPTVLSNWKIGRKAAMEHAQHGRSSWTKKWFK
ncbi:Mitochondrial-processing peptidase subunit alpha, partial [Quaeritorhiza haematococci]